MTDQFNGSELAIVGMACRFPGANDLETYWDNLRNGIESIARLTDAELLAAGVSPAEVHDPNYVKAAPLIDNIDRFDAAFFGYSSVEAELMDPQQRVLLECAWEALEHAGYNPDTYKEPVGVYAGAKTNTYLFHLAANRDYLQSVDFFQLILGGDLALLSTRLSYKFDLKGPSYAVQTACSTSLVALHLACQSLLIGECRMALAGTVAINVPHQVGYMYRPGDILSPDGRCRPFDAKAEGTLFGSGAGVVVLKRLDDALADGDTIYAVIKGSATNNDGSVKATFTAPSIDGQANVIIEALACSGVEADTISYVEAHGTGTALGDPIEVLALTEAFRASTERNGFCAIGSVKSNLGHLDAAAGMSGLIKTVLALQHRQIPPSLHYESPNPQIDFAGSPFYVNTKLIDWTRNGHPRRAGISSFGFGGTNAHVILEEAPTLPATDAGRPWQVLPLSARTETALEQASANLAAYLRRNPDANLADVAYTLQVGRKVFDHRRTVICRNHSDALAALETSDHQFVFTGKTATTDRPVVFLFPGQGAQYAQMARDLYQDEPIFRAQLDRCAELLRPHLGLDLRELLYPNDDRRPTTDDRRPEPIHPLTRSPAHPLTVVSGQWSVVGGRELEQTRYAQPALFAVEYALAQLWMAWGVRPQAMLGHSIGEYVAACLAGVFALEDALKLVAERGRLMQSLPEGAMLSVALPEAELPAYLGTELSLAAVNGPAQCVVAGPRAAIEALEQRLSAQEVKCRRLHTSHAFHSTMMEPIVEQFAAAVARVERRAPQLPYVSNVSGGWITTEEATDPAYWARHLRQPVRFAEGLAAVTQGGMPVLLEVGPGTTLGTLARRQVRESPVAASVRHPDDQRADTAFILTALSRLWLAGVVIDWPKVHDQEQRRRVPLPTYPFERRRYWLLPDAPASTSASARIGQALLDKRPDVGDWFYLPSWQRQPLQPVGAAAERGNWLIFCDTGGPGDRLTQRLEQLGCPVIRVRPGTTFSQADPHEYAIDPGAPADYRKLLDDLQTRRIAVGAIVHLWSVTGSSTPSLDDAQVDALQMLGFYSLLYLSQALGHLKRSDALQLTVLSSNLQNVTGQEALCPEQATILGPCRVLPKEYPFITCRAVDVVTPPGADEQWELLSEQILAECLAGDAEPLVAYRDGERWVQRYQATRLEAPPQFNAGLRERGVYMITGGLGGIGLVLAEDLARSVQARLVLTGRTALPPREAWASWPAEHGDDDPTSARIGQIQALERHGAEVLVVQADVTDYEQMRAAIRQALDRFGAIHGVIHAAGIAGGGVVQLKTAGQAAQVLAPKLRGTRVLDALLQEQHLDFFALCSSLQTVLGDFGQVDYCAANAFCDAFALQRATRQGRPYIAIGWDNWQEVGIAVHTAVPEHLREWRAELLEKAISSQEGPAVLHRILAAPHPHIVVSTQDLEARIRLSQEFNSTTILTELSSPLPAQARATPALAGTNAASRAEIEQRLADIWRQVLSVPHVGLHDNFFDLGGNSLAGIQLIGELKRQLDIQLAPVALFEAPTVGALARLLVPETGQPGSAGAGAPASDPAEPQDIAIIGMAGRFPGASSVETFWDNLRDGIESIAFFSDDELAAAGIPAELIADPRYVKARPILDDVESFDAALFGYTPREAELLDPQLRLFMETVWTALDDAGYDPDSYAGAIGVYAGSSLSTYLLGLYSQPDLARSVDPVQALIGNDKDALTTSVSYKLNLRGPSLAVQTFCSTSLVALHLACQSLQRGECSIAIAGGVSIVVPQQSGYHYQEDSIVSPDGHCRAFSAGAQGTLFGNGVGVVVLKPLAAALADGDTIHALIKGTAINNDGSHKVGYTAPSVEGQAEVIRAALKAAGVTPESISYVEAHGTGTALGDPIEIAALSKAFRNGTQRSQFCAIGSVKANIGHLDRAAGVASLIKTVLALKHRRLPPSLHYEAPNPQIDFAGSPFYVNAALTEWRSEGGPLRAGVSSLGFGGTNAHVILEEAPGLPPGDPARPWQLLVLSARTHSALETATANLAGYLARNPDCNLADLAHTLRVGRKALGHRRFVVCQDYADACAVLAQPDPARVFDAVQETDTLPVLFMFSGQGTQYVGMGCELYQTEPVFRDWVDRCAEALRPHLGLDLREVLYPADDRRPTTDDRRSDSSPSGVGGQWSVVGGRELEQTQYAQPALFVVEYALAQLWMSWGVYPQALIGHSIGEYVAACLAGVFSLEDALKLVAARGRLMQAMPEGAMLAVPLPERELEPLLNGQISIAAVNGPAQSVVAGPGAAIAALEQTLRARGVQARNLHTSHAFHSAMMDGMLDTFAAQVAQVARQAPQLPVISCTSGTWLTAEQALDPLYWAQHARRAVRFADGLRTATDNMRPVLLEVGPGRALSSLAQQQLGPAARSVLASLPHPHDRGDARALFLTTLGRLWLAGYPVAWSAGVAHERRRRIPLPAYPFERQRYWLTPSAQPQAGRPAAPQGKRANIADWFYLPAWKLAPLTYNAPADASPDECWLILCDTCGVGAALAQRLARRAPQVVLARCGERYGRDDQGYTLNPAQPADFDELLNDLLMAGQIPNRIVYLWGISPQMDAEPPDGAGAAFYGLLWLIQTIGRQTSPGPIALTVVADQTHDLTAAEQAQPEQAPLLGLCKVIPQEYLTVRCRHIEIAVPREGRQAAQLAGQLYAELCSEQPDELVAYRSRQRWTQTFEPLRLEAGRAPFTALRERGVYVITGGLAEIGLALSEYIAQAVHAQLILIEDVALPEREQWEQWLATHSQRDSVSRKLHSIRRLEQLGAGVQVIQADLTDVAQMRAAIGRALADHGTLHGVVYAAGIVGERAFRAIQELDRAECEAHFAAKMHGLRVLKQALSGVELDFCLISSSVSCFLGGRGYGAYAAANHFVDAFIRRHNTGDDLPWIGVNWDAWQLDKVTTISENLAQLAMTLTEGGEVFRRILSYRPADHVIVSTADLPARMHAGAQAIEALRQNTQQPDARQPGALHPRPALQTPYVAPGSLLEQTLAQIWQQALGFEQLGIHDNFFDLGGDSLIAIQVVSRMREALRQEISVISLYEQLTIKNLARLFEQEAQEADTDPFEQREQRTSRRNQLRQTKLSHKRGQRYSAVEQEELRD